MKTTQEFKKFLSELTLGIFLVTSLNPIPAIAASSTDNDLIYPLKEISELDCRYQEFDTLSSSCKQDLPILKTKDYTKYATKDWGYNDYTRIYTVLWWSSYKYGWDVWNWWHMWVDIATSKWTPVYAMADWKVIVAKNLVALWNTVSIEHIINWKTIISNYSHLSKINAKKWDKVKVWKKIWEVWSTWNSTWNHLHFQIDLKASFHPTYYDYNSCPYSYYEISEKWLCYDELERITIDPLLFLETKWAVLSKISSSSTVYNYSSTNNNLDIFNTTVYIWYSKTDIKEVQEVFEELWYYNWSINWDYEDVIDDIIEYQIDKNVIANKNSDWAGRFWPKTRAQAKKDYLLAINNDSKDDDDEENSIKTVKISRKNLLTREEIEAKEVEDFLKDYNVSLEFVNAWWNVEVWKASTLKLEITNSKWKPFRWNMPSWMTFIIDQSKVSVFPQKLYYFTDGKRDIKLTWLSAWNTKLYIKIWNQTIKTIPIKVYSKSSSIIPTKATILWTNSIILGEQKTWIVLFQDKTWSKLINLSYDWNLQLKTNDDVQICIKSWSLKNINTIFKTDCRDEDFQDYRNFTYNDTVWGLLIYDYKVTWTNPKIEIINKDTNKLINSKKIFVSNPKWLVNSYEYKDEVIELLQDWIIDWINKWYFQEKSELNEYDALSWIRNTLIYMNNDNSYKLEKSTIEQNLRNVFTLRAKSSKYKTIDREELLNLTYKYLILDKSNNNLVIEYKDLEDEENMIANTIFDKSNTWKDRFWENYFRPNEKITRWEWAYMLSQVIQKNKQVLLTIK